MSSNTYSLKLKLPIWVTLPNQVPKKVNREAFFQWLWDTFLSQGLLGIHEGTVLTEEVESQGLEAQTWIVDSGVAPSERDWVGHQKDLNSILYFGSFMEAEQVRNILDKIPELTFLALEEQTVQDWDAEWKASFLNAGEGVFIPPFWKVIPPWKDFIREDKSLSENNPIIIKINPGAGFGTGTHETTQLCMEAISLFLNNKALKGKNALDFGSGSGILSICMGLLGAKVDAVEIDPLARDNSIENAALNKVLDLIEYHPTLLPEEKKYDIAVANVLRPVLIEFSEPLVTRLEVGGMLILSGLIERDLDQIINSYSILLGKAPAHILRKGEWRGLVYQ